MRVRLGNTSEGAGTFYFNSPQLELSANATDFEPGRVSSVFIKDTLGKWDEMLTDGYILKGGKYDVQLNGELDWKIRSSNFDGYRTIEINGGLLQSSSERYLVKYSGSLVPFFSSITEVNEGYDRAQWTSGGRFTISISNLETGWGENYTPSPDEIKVYFNGWKMYTQGEGRRSLYNGTGNKAWVKITRLKDNITPIDPNDITTTLPTTVADMDAQGNQYTPYKLSYKLLRPYVKTAELEGDLQVFKGKNHISLYEGTVVRERVSFENTDGAYVELNKEPHNNSYFKFKTYKIYNLYKNNDPVQLVRNSDKGWSLISDQLSYGRYRLSINRKLFDPTASYYVTYLVLDKHAYTTPIPEATLEYEGSLKSVVQRNTSQIAQNNRRLDVQEFWQRNVAVKGEGEVFQHGEVETTVNAGATATITIPFSRAYRYIPSITVSKGSSNSTIDLIDVSYRYDTKTRTSFTLLVKNNHAQSIRASVTWMAVGK